MNDPSNEHETEMIAQVERLACGELDGADFQSVLDWLEDDPRRWRTCGLAFLEAQSWSEALGGWPSLPPQPQRNARRQTAIHPEKTPPRRSLATWISAACLLLAFTLGLAARDLADNVAPPQAGTNGEQSIPIAGEEDQPMLASLAVHQGSLLGPSGAIQIPVVPRDAAAASKPSPLEEIPEYVRRQWERRGYELTSERRFLFAHLADGQQIVVPVDQIVVHSIPQKVN